MGISANDDKAPMAKEELLTFEGVVDEICPNGRTGVMVHDHYRGIAYTAGKIHRYRIRSIVGDGVHVGMSAHDLSNGTIAYRKKVGGASAALRRQGVRR